MLSRTITVNTVMVACLCFQDDACQGGSTAWLLLQVQRR